MSAPKPASIAKPENDSRRKNARRELLLKLVPRTSRQPKTSASRVTMQRAPAPATLASSVYDRLRADILTGELEPGRKLRIEFLGKRYHTGHSPIREALNRLVPTVSWNGVTSAAFWSLRPARKTSSN